MPLAEKVLLVGWDAADWKIVNRLIDQGLMPTTARLIREGVKGNLATLDPPLSPMLWTSIGTGKTADKHGVLGFTEPRPDGTGVQPVRSTSRKVKALWNILTQEGKRAHTVGWWPSHPAEPISGVAVSNMYQQATAGPGEPWPLPDGTVHPPDLAETLARYRVHPGELTAAHLQPFLPDLPAFDLEDEQQKKAATTVAKILAHAASIHAASTWILEHQAWDFLAVYHDAIDHFGHAFMRFHPPRMPHIDEEVFARYRHVVTAGYRFHDMMLDRLLDLAGEDATVLLVSDHGFHSDHLRPPGIPHEPAGPAVEHRNFGVFAAKGPGVRRGEQIYGAGLLDVTPTVLTLMGLPVGRDMDGKPLVQAFDRPVEPQYVDSWEDVEGDAGMHDGETQRDPWAEQQALEQLAALGYIDAAPDDERQEKMLQVSVNESNFYLARVYLSTGRPAQALPLLEALHEAGPDQQRYRLRLAECYQKLGRLGDSRRLLEPVLQSAENEEGTPSPAADLMMGTILLQEGDVDEALRLLTRAEAADPLRPALHQRIGQAYLQTEHYADAERAFLRALDIDGDSPVAHHGLARAYLGQKRHADAVEAALRTVGLHYFNPVAHYHLGLALRALGIYDRAADAFNVAVTQAPGMRKAHKQLEYLYAWHLNQPAKAVEHQRFASDRIRTDA